MTKADKQNELTPRQVKAIPHLIASSSYEEGRRAARISRNTLYVWLRDPAFVAELKRQRDAVVADALESLKGSITRAVDTLCALLDSESETIRRGAANDILNCVLRMKEMEEIEDRLSSVEKIVLERRTYQ